MDRSRAALETAKSQYSADVLQQIVECADIHYPDMMLDEQIDEMVGEFEANLKQQNIKLDDYLRLTNSSKDDLRERYREPAESSLKQSLVLRELVKQRNIEVSDEDVELRLTLAMAGYGDSPEIRKLFDSPYMRNNMRNDLIMSCINEHLVAIGRGEDPAQAIAALRARMKSDVERASTRNDRLQRYQSQSELAPASAPTETLESPAERAEAALVTGAQPAGDTASES